MRLESEVLRLWGLGVVAVMDRMRTRSAFVVLAVLGAGLGTSANKAVSAAHYHAAMAIQVSLTQARWATDERHNDG